MALAICYLFTTMILQWCTTPVYNAAISTVNSRNLTGRKQSVDLVNSTSPRVEYINFIAPAIHLLISTNSTVKNSLSNLSTSLANSSNSTFLFYRKNHSYRLAPNKTNQRNHSNFCNLRISEEALEDVLELMYIRTVNIVEIEVSLVSKNKCRRFPKMKWPWASEIGRTIVTLVTRANEFIFASPVYTKILSVGTKYVNIEVVEESVGYLQDGEKGSNEIFKFLLQQLSRSDTTLSYGLCKAQQDETSPWTVYNCCRITGRRNLTVCADYTSPVVKHALPFVIAVFFLSFFLVLPFVLEYIRFFPSNDFYKTSESHMSLLSIASRILFGKSGWGVPMLRRSIIVLFLYFVLFLRADFYRFLWLKIIFFVWGIFFILYDIFKFNEKHKKCAKSPLGTILITDLTKRFSKYFSFITYIQSKLDININKIIEDGTPFKPFINLIIAIPVIFILLLASVLALLLVALNLLFFIMFDFLNSYAFCIKCDKKDGGPWWLWALCGFEYSVLFCMRLLTFPMIALFTSSVFIFTVSIVVGLLLNGEFFNPYVAPIVTIFIYFWRNWKFSVETKYLELKTAIVEICKDQASAEKTENEFRSSGMMGGNEANNSYPNIYNSPIERICSLCQSTTDVTELTEATSGNKRNSQNTSRDLSTSAQREDLRHIRPSNLENSTSPRDQSPREMDEKIDETIKFDRDGEAMIPKGFYNEIYKDELPLNELLFHFFRRVTFVSVYAFVMYNVMTLARDSGVTESVQVITAIAGVLIPFVFDTIWAEESLTQKTANYLALKERIKHKIKVLKHSLRAGNSTGSISIS